MQQFTAFRLRILSALALASVAHGCAGKVDGSDEPEASKCPALPGVPERLAAAEQACTRGAPCFTSPSTLCLDLATIDGTLRACAAPARADRCPAVVDLNPTSCEVTVTGEATLAGGQCCYPTTRLSCAVPGRALSTGGSFVLPEVLHGAPIPVVDTGLEPALRRNLSELWCEGARFEHASVASFARSALQLMTLGAPAELIAGCQRASLDEIEHARLCFALASRFAGRELRPGKLPVDAASFAPVSIVELAVENVVGGCIGETVAALTATAQLALATDPEVRAALEIIARDEARHAELAWRIAKWASEAGGIAVRTRMAAAFEEAFAARYTERDTPPPAVAVGLGHIGLAEEARLRARILDEVVAPCAGALLAA